MSAEEIRRTLDIFVEPGSVCELRVLGGQVRPNGGFFDDLDKMAEVAHMFDKGGRQDGLFFTINPVHHDLLARANNKMCQGKPELTKGADILKRRWLYVDIDVKGKLSGISSRDSEHDEALKAALDLRDRMVSKAGWPLPVYADSGNGAHLQYRIDLLNDKESTELVKRTLQCLDRMLDHPALEVDAGTHDPNRIAKLYGTMVKKGEEIEDRHHRRSHIIEVPDQLIAISKEQLIEFVSIYEPGVDPEPVYRGGVSQIEDMPAWLKTHNLPWKSTKPADGGGTWYILDECPGCHNSDGNACAVAKYPPPRDGQEAKCYHKSCSIKDWESFIAVVDPEYAAARRQSRQERDQNRREREEMLELDIEDLCNEHTVNEGKSNERTDYKFSPEKAADAIIQRYDIVTTADDKIWVYRSGYYSTEWWKGIVDLVNNVAGDHFPTKMKKELESKVQSKTRAKEELFYRNPYLLCCKNVTIDMLTGKVLEHSPEHYLNSPSAFVYTPAAWPDAFIQLLDESCSNDIDRLTLIDWIVATCCLVEFEFILFMTGNGSNGKRMYEDVLKAIFPGFTEHIGLEEMNKSRFAKAQLKVARTNVFNETNVDKAGTETIKSLSGGDEQSGDVKNQKERSKWRSFTQLIFDTNGMPRFNDTSYGFKRRFTRVKMMFTFVDNPDPKNTFEKKADPTLGARLVSENNLSGILNLVIVRAKEIAEDRKICRRDDDFDEYEEDTHSFNNFAERFITFDALNRNDPEFRIASSDLFGRFETFTNYGGRKMSQFSFSKRIGELNRQPSKTIEGSQGCPAYRGFKGLFFDKAKFDQYIKVKMNDIANSNTSNDSLTSNKRVKEDTVTSITGYNRIATKARINKEGCIVGEKSKTILVVEPVTDSDSLTPKSVSSDPFSRVVKEPVGSIKAELEKADAATQAKEEHFAQIAKPKLIQATITMDCEFNGVKYKVGDLICDTKENIRKLPAMIKEKIDKCSMCGEHVKLSARNGRDGVCQSCFKKLCPQMHGYMATSQMKETTCKFCGRKILRRELISKIGECEACYYKNLGIEKSEALKFGGEAGL